MFRIGYIGYYDVFDITTALAAAELLLVESGADVERGIGVSRAPRRTARSSVPERSGGSGVLVREPIAESDPELLRSRRRRRGRRLDLGEMIGDFDAIVVRSATSLDAGLIERAGRLKVIGRAGVGADNVDVDAATRRGIVVANAPEAIARRSPPSTRRPGASARRGQLQAHGGAGRGGRGPRPASRDRAGREDARRPRPRADRPAGRGVPSARAPGRRHDPYVALDRRELGVESAATPEDVYCEVDLITLHLPLKRRDAQGSSTERRSRRMRDGGDRQRRPRRARGRGRPGEAIGSGKVAGAALDVFGKGALRGDRCSGST